MEHHIKTITLIMIRTILYTAFLLIMANGTHAQVSESRKLASFSAVNVADGIALIYTPSETVSVKAEANNAAALQLLSTEVVNGVLIIKGLKENGNKLRNTTVYLSGPAIGKFEVITQAAVTFENGLDFPKVEITLKDKGSVKGNIHCEQAIIRMSSWSDLVTNVTGGHLNLKMETNATATVSGTVTLAEIQASTTARCTAKNLMTLNAVVYVNTAAFASIMASGTLDAKASSHASVAYYGNPVTTIQKSLSGTVSRR